MSTTRKSKSVKCPFYRTDEACKIICEGLFGNVSVHHIFINKREKTDYINNYCCRQYKNCRYFLSLMLSKYRDEDDNVNYSYFNRLGGTDDIKHHRGAD